MPIPLSKADRDYLEELAAKSKLPAVRLQTLCVLDGLNALSLSLVEQALADSNPAVRANAIRLSETLLTASGPSAR